MSALFKKIIISLLVFLVAFTSIAPSFLPVKAQDATPAPVGSWYNQDFKSWWTKVYDNNISPDNEIFGERYTAAQVQWVIYSLWAFIFNIIVPQNITACALTNNIDLNACANEVKSLLSSNTNDTNPDPTSQDDDLLKLVFNNSRPFSGISYFSQKLNNFRLVPEAYAQNRPGFGFSALQPIQNMWKAFRDIAYGLFVIVAIVFSFMIMFRVKISPQVVISVQSAIPKIVIALIVVTFSYAIAGFLIDFMYVIIGFISFLLAPLVPTVTIIQPNTYKATDVFNLLTLGRSLESGSGGIGGIFNLIFVYLSPLIGLLFILTFFGGILSSGFGFVIGIFFMVLLVVVIIIALWMAIKTIFALFKAFANLVLLTIFAPLQLALGPLIPNFGFGQWLKSYLSHLSVFVVTGVLWLFAWIFGLLTWKSFSSSGGLVLPTASTDVWPPLLGTSSFGTALLFAGTSLVFFTLIPKATEVVQGFISGKPFAYGSAIGEAVGPLRLGGMAGVQYIASSAEREQIKVAKREGYQEVPPIWWVNVLKRVGMYR